MLPFWSEYRRERARLHRLWGLERKDFGEILSASLLANTGGIVAGILLALSVGKLEAIPALFLLIPGFLEMRGNIGGALSARLSSALILGYMRPHVSNQRVLVGNVLASFILAIAVSFVLGVAAYDLEYLLFGTASSSIILIALVAGILANLIEIPAVVLFNFWAFRKGYDPNNLMGPYATTVGDIVSIAALLIAVVIV